MFKRREEYNTYLTHMCRHHCSGDSPVKRWNISSFQPTLWLSSPVDVVYVLYLIFLPGSLPYSDVYRRESGRYHTLYFFSTFFIINVWMRHFDPIYNSFVNNCVSFSIDIYLQEPKYLIWVCCFDGLFTIYPDNSHYIFHATTTFDDSWSPSY